METISFLQVVTRGCGVWCSSEDSSYDYRWRDFGDSNRRFGTALVEVSGYTRNDVAVWTSTYTRMEGNARDHLLKTAPQSELDLAEEAKDQCPVGAIY